MSGINFNDTDLLALTNAGINGLEVTEATLNSDITVTAIGPSWQATGITVDINTLENERVQVSYHGSASSTGANAFVITGYRIDSGTPVPIAAEHIFQTGIQTDIDFSIFTAELTAGKHTIELMVAKGGDGGWDLKQAGNSTQSTLRAIRFKSFGIGAGTIVIQDTIPGNKAISAVYPAWENTGFEVTINTIGSEDVLLTFVGTMILGTGGAPQPAYIGYQVDSDSTVRAISPMITAGADGDRDNLSFSTVISGLSAGLHTIKIKAASAAGSGYSVMATGSKLSAIQYRGGLIPIQDDGVEIVNKPSALNFINALVEADGTKAKITVPAPWTSFTPTGSWNVNVTYTGMYRIVGDTLECRVKIVLSGAPNAATLTINLPSGKTIDTTKLLTPSAGITPLGNTSMHDTSGATIWHGTVAYMSTTSVRPMSSAANSTYVKAGTINATIPVAFGNGDKVECIFSVPIT